MKVNFDLEKMFKTAEELHKGTARRKMTELQYTAEYIIDVYNNNSRDSGAYGNTHWRITPENSECSNAGTLELADGKTFLKWEYSTIIEVKMWRAEESKIELKKMVEKVLMIFN